MIIYTIYTNRNDMIICQIHNYKNGMTGELKLHSIDSFITSCGNYFMHIKDENKFK